MTSMRLVLICGLLTTTCAYAEDGASPNKDNAAVQRKIDAAKPCPPVRPLNNLSLSYELGLNINTTFKGFGAFRPNNPGPATSGANHTYDDGYNKIDSQGNDHSAQGFPNTTTFWGYQNDSQWN